MTDTCLTIRVKDDVAPGGFVIINLSDFDPEKYTAMDPLPVAPLPPYVSPDWKTKDDAELNTIAAK
jgi:hypothetical protein